MHHQHRKALRSALGAGAGLLLTSGLLAACATGPAVGLAGATTTRTGGHVEVTNQLDGTVSVINTQTNRVIATMPAGRAPEGVAVTPDRRHVYVADNGSGEVSVLSTRTDKIVAIVHVGMRPSGVGLSPDGRHLYVANGGSNSASGIDTRTNPVTAPVPLRTPPASLNLSPRASREPLTWGTREPTRSTSLPPPTPSTSATRERTP